MAAEISPSQSQASESIQESSRQLSSRGKHAFARIKETIEHRRGWVLLPIILLGFAIRLTGLLWGDGYCYFAQGDGIEAYSVAVNYAHGEARAQYLGQPNYNEKSKLPGPLWTIFCHVGLRLGGSIQGVIFEIILLNTAAIFLTYKLADLTVGFPASLWAALLFATQPWAVFYSVLVYNPDVMAFLACLFFFALWDVVQRPKSRSIFWACLLLLILPQFHMSGLMLVPAAAVVLVLAKARLNFPWLIAGLIGGGLAYIPYLHGEMAHGWQNTIGMFSGHERHSWEGLKALSAPLSFLVSWAPRWTRSTHEYWELGKACFGSFVLFAAFSLLSAVVALFLIAGLFLKLKTTLSGTWRSPRDAFNRSPGILFLSGMVAVPIFFALISRNPFHTRYCMVFLPALFGLAGCAAETILSVTCLEVPFTIALIISTAANVWFMPAMYHYQGTRIEHGPAFVPSFHQLETIYQKLKKDAGEGQHIDVLVDRSYLRASPADNLYHDAALIRPYTQVREKESGTLPSAGLVLYQLCHGEKRDTGNRKIVYQARGVTITRCERDE